MNKPGCLIILFVILGCTSSKYLIDFKEVEKGNLLDKAKEIELSEFIPLWVENRIHSKMDFNLHELYRDSDFTYFGKHANKYEGFFKIKNADLFRVNYKTIVGDSIRNKMYNEIIPQSDKNKAQADCGWGSFNGSYKYRYLEMENSIEITFNWKVKCEFFVTRLDKKYIAKYNIENRIINESL